MTNVATAVVLPALTTVIVASVSIPLLISRLRRWGAVDLPGHRTLHTGAVPRGVGMALALAMATGLAVSGTWLWPVWAALVGFTALGAWDDLSSLRPTTRLALQFGLGAVTSVGLVAQDGAGWWLVAVGTLLLVSTVNAVNFMDGINGITGLHAIVWGVAYGYILAKVADTALIPLAACLAAAGIAFLPWNIPRARGFLGDSGSYLIGGTAGVLALACILAGQPLAALCPLATYATDTGSAVIKRLRSGAKLTEPHATHVYQQLAARKWSHTTTSLVTVGFTVMSTLCGVLVIGATWPAQAAAILGVVAINGFYLLLPRALSIA